MQYDPNLPAELIMTAENPLKYQSIAERFLANKPAFICWSIFEGGPFSQRVFFPESVPPEIGIRLQVPHTALQLARELHNFLNCNARLPGKFRPNGRRGFNFYETEIKGYRALLVSATWIE